MGKLTTLLKKKKPRRDSSQERAGSFVSGASTDETMDLPLSLSIPTTLDGGSGSGSSSSSSGPEGVSMSLMDDIMDELAGGTGTPETPQPTQTSSRSDLGDFGLAFELSRQLDRDAAQAGLGSRSTFNHTNGLPKVGKLENNSAFKDNAFLRSQQQQRQQQGSGQQDTGVSHRPVITATTPYRSIVPGATTNTIPSAHWIGGLVSSKEAEEKEKAALAAAKWREASKKVNAQLPSDDEASDSDSEKSETGPLDVGRLKKQAQEQQQQQQQHGQGQQEANTGKVGSPRRVSFSKKTKPSHPEDVIDRMRGRHRALLAEAAAAARDEYFDEYMDDFGYVQPQVQPQASMGYGMQYGVDPNMDGFILQQRQQQMYYGQGMPQPPSTQYRGRIQSAVMTGYPYGQHAQVPFHGQLPMHNSGRGDTFNQFSGQPHDQGLGLVEPDYSTHSKGNVASENLPMSRRGSYQQGVALTGRHSEDSWTEPCPPMPGVSAHRPIPSDGGYCSLPTHGRYSNDAPLEEIQESESGDEDTTPSRYNKVKGDEDLVKTVDSLAISKAVADAKEEGEEAKAGVSTEDAKADRNIAAESYEGNPFEEPDSLKGSTMVGSVNGRKEIATGSSTTNSPRDGDESDSESSEDGDRPIIMSRRGSARGPFPLPKINTGIASTGGVDYPEDGLVSPTNGQMPYLTQVRRTSQAYPHTPYLPQHQQYIPMNYQFPTPQMPSPMSHHHSYSVDKGTAAALAGHHPQPTAAGSYVGGTPMSHATRRNGVHPLSGPKEPRQTIVSSSNGGHSGTSNGASSGMGMPSQYPIPATTLLNSLPRRAQSVRVRTQNLGPSSLGKLDSPSRQQQQPLPLPSQQQQQSRPRGSVEVVRLPNGGYQSILGLDLNGGRGPFIQGYSEPLSPPSHHPSQQTQEPQQRPQHHPLHQGYYMGYHPMYPNELYPSHPHQQLIQTVRR